MLAVRGQGVRRVLQTSVAAAADLLFPLRCPCCGSECDQGSGKSAFCLACEAAFDEPALPACPTCAQRCSEADLTRGNCGNCRGRKLLFREARTAGVYQGLLRTMVLKMKHAAHEPLAIAAGMQLAEVLRKRPFHQAPGLVAAVPMHWLKRMWSGNNSSEVIARSVARQLDLRFASGLLVCRRLLRRQATLTTPQRHRNVRGAFRVSPRWKIAGRTVLLVDDVMTTGATAHEASRALLAGGAAEVFVATIARSSPNI